jgi:isoleucyl-tRNA synthetase
MITNAQPWDNLKFDLEGVNEVKRKFFRALQNTYAFFSLYANVDGFTFSEDKIDIKDRPEIDRWVISKLNSLIKEVDAAYADYEPTKAGRLIQEFVVENLSNWHVRLSRKRFWRGDYGQDKIAAYQTLYECLTVIAKLAAPIAPFYAEQLYRDLNSVTSKEDQESVHLAFMPEVVESEIDTDLEERMSIAQQVSSMILALRKKESIKVRQPLQKIMVPVLNDTFERQLSDVANLIKTETNIKEIEFLNDTKGVLVKQIKPDFKALGPKYGKLMKGIAAAVNQFEQEDINELERNGQIQIEVQDENVTLTIDDVEISTDDIPGWLVMTENGITVALDIQLNDELRHEGITRELVNRIQNLRKDSGLDVTDRIEITVESQELLTAAVNDNFDYICAETLADELNFVDSLSGDNVHESELNEDLTCKFKIERT